MTEYSGGKFRKKKVNFSMISNEIIRDDTVSLKTKGLYALIQSYITMDDFIENLVLLIVEVLNMPDQATIRVNQTDQKAELVKERFRKLRYKHIEYVRLVFSEFTGEISSMRNYLITSLYNAVSTCDIYFKQRVQHDMYEKGDKTWQVVK